MLLDERTHPIVDHVDVSRLDEALDLFKLLGR
jgi:hypothetical protein